MIKNNALNTAGKFIFLAVFFLTPGFSFSKGFTPSSIPLKLTDEINSSNSREIPLYNDISLTWYAPEETFDFFPEDYTDSSGNIWSFAGWYYEDETAETEFDGWDYREKGYELFARYNPVLQKEEAVTGDLLVHKTISDTDCEYIVRPDYEYTAYSGAFVFGIILSTLDSVKVLGTQAGKKSWYTGESLSKDFDLQALDMAVDLTGSDNYGEISASYNASSFYAFTYAENYGTENSLSSFWQTGWYLPSRLEVEKYLLRNFGKITELISRYGSQVDTSESFWTASVDETYNSWVPCYLALVDGEEDIYFSYKANISRRVVVIHELP